MQYPKFAGEAFHVHEGQRIYIPGGYVLLARKFFDSPDWQFSGPVGRNLMVVCLAKANFEPRTWHDGQETITIKRGQFVTTIESLAAACGTGTSIKKIRLAITKLVKSNFLGYRSVKRSVHSYSMITVVKYDDYQNFDNYEGTSRARVGHEDGPERAASNTVKEGRKKDKDHSNGDRPLTAHQRIVEHYKTTKGFTDVPNWDRVHFPRAAKSAAALISMGATVESASQAITDLGKGFDVKNLDWTIETIVKHYPSWLKKHPELVPVDPDIERRREVLRKKLNMN